MKFTTTIAEFKKAAAIPFTVAPKKSTIPILSCVLLDTGAMTITGTDLDVFATIKLAGKKQVKAKGKLKSKPDDKVCIEASLARVWLATFREDGPLLIETGKADKDGKVWSVNMTSGDLSVRLEGFDTKFFPVMPSVPVDYIATLPAATFRKAITTVEVFTSRVETRYTLRGCLLRLAGGKLTACGTDGHRLAECVMDVSATEDATMILPSGAVDTVAAFCKGKTEVRMSASLQERVFFFDGDSVVSSRLLTGQFPKYEYIYELTTPNRTVTANSLAMLSSITRARVVEDKRSNCLYVAVSATGIKLEGKPNSQSEVPANVAGAPMRFGVSSIYLAECIKACASDKVSLLLSAPDSAIQAVPETLAGDLKIRTLVMPMRV